MNVFDLGVIRQVGPSGGTAAHDAKESLFDE